MLSGSGAFYTILQTVKAALIPAFVNSDGGSLNRVAIVPGAIAWDECDTCGLLALATVRTYLSDEFPIETAQPVTVSNAQGALLCADMAVQAIRCAPTPQGNELSPSVLALEKSAQAVNSDAYTVMCTVLATLDTMSVQDDIVSYVIRPLNYVGPEGACVGSELTFSVAVIR